MESVGPNNEIIGIFANENMCIKPLSIDITKSNLLPRQITSAGEDKLVLCSGIKAFGNNSMYVETIPGLSDYSSVDIEFGEVLMFYGNRLRHFNKTNDTGLTRCSFNFLATIPSTASLIPIIAIITIKYVMENSSGVRFKNK